jgi:hypothetical protein
MEENIGLTGLTEIKAYYLEVFTFILDVHIVVIDGISSNTSELIFRPHILGKSQVTMRLTLGRLEPNLETKSLARSLPR